ncbi:MAG TPA: hypothetical protein VF230_17355 [Acidimicrobiales bacterium]
MGERAERWLGLERRDDGTWLLPVTEALRSGADALFGGCATAAALVVADAVVPQPLVAGFAHFGALARTGTEVVLAHSIVASARTMTHVEVVGRLADGAESFLVRAAAGDRPPVAVEGAWVDAPNVPPPDDCAPFDHPVHADTWAERFTWRLAASTPNATWWVRPLEDTAPLVAAAVLVDYVTYGSGRALGAPMGGLSVDNVVRLHHPPQADGWYLLDVRVDAVTGGFAHGTARLFAEDQTLLATGTQSFVANQWDWRLPSEQ